MLYPAMSELLKNVDSRYLLVNVVAHRARQLSIESCRSAFSFASPKENAGLSEPASSERAPAIRGVSYPLSPFLPLQIANASLVCNLRTGGISISPRSPLEPTRKTALVFLDFSREA